ncbi:universal stress protein [Corynebacterium spheniscorum]|uniref:universal stress protein n=1 Tax=Corynebacterium spheniscorum TaxID=185761 RepID=UPI0021E0567B|nr:universal stress protein [Corynebacterium spheniscorum]
MPVALAPRGYQARAVKRLNCAVGTRPGSGSLVREGILSAKNSGLPLRLVALVESSNGSPAAEEARANTQRILDEARQDLPTDIGQVEIAVGQTDDVAGALDYVGFEDSDLMMVGSSRVAQKHSIFVGSAAMHILRTLTIPLVVVPRDYQLSRRDAGDEQRA